MSGYRAKSNITFPRLLHFPSKCNGWRRQFSQVTYFSLRRHRLFFCTCAQQHFGPLGSFYISVSKTINLLIAENIIVWCICSIAIVALWNRPQERRCMSVCPASRDPNQLLVQVSRLWMLQRSLNKHQEDLLDWSRFFSNIWGTQIWDSFTWTLKQQRLLC